MKRGKHNTTKIPNPRNIFTSYMCDYVFDGGKFNFVLATHPHVLPLSIALMPCTCEKNLTNLIKQYFSSITFLLLWLFGGEKVAKNRHIVCQRTSEWEKCLKKSEQQKILWQRKRLERIAVGKELYFFTIIADILFGYCDVFAGGA